MAGLTIERKARVNKRRPRRREVLRVGNARCNVAAVVTTVAKRKLPIFAAFPDVQRDDLIQVGLLAVHQRIGLDAAAGKPSSWVYNVAQCGMIDLHRKRTAMGQHDAAYAAMKPGDVVEVIDPPDEEPEVWEGELIGNTWVANAAPLVEWCEAVRRGALNAYGSQLQHVGRKRPRIYRVAQIGPLALLMARLGVGAMGARWVLLRRPDVLAALGWKHTPGRQMFEDAEWLMRRGESAQRRDDVEAERDARRCRIG
jgi:hypothetical protein